MSSTGTSLLKVKCILLLEKPKTFISAFQLHLTTCGDTAKVNSRDSPGQQRLSPPFTY